MWKDARRELYARLEQTGGEIGRHMYYTDFAPDEYGSNDIRKEDSDLKMKLCAR